MIRKKGGICLLSLCMIMMNQYVSVKAEDTAMIVMPQINPTPQKVVQEGTGFQLTTHVNVIGEATADKDAIVQLKKVLVSNGIQINESPNQTDTNIIIEESDDHLAEAKALEDKLSVEDASSLGDEGYVLLSKKDHDQSNILIEGKAGAGTFYGVQTLRQMLQKKDHGVSIPEVAIRDEPDLKDRGIVEGFYGTPWSQAARLDQIKFYGQNKLNLYIYAPKDDPYHREKWREPYPASDMTRMQELIHTAKENKVNFVFAISPGNDIHFDGAQGNEDMKALITKAQSMYDMGVRSFAIFFDDISDHSGVKQANVLNTFNKEFVEKKGDVTPLITVPTEYFSSAMQQEGNKSPYTKDFSETLDPGIEVMWTGHDVVSQSIDKVEADKVKQIYNRKMGIWWNYPVTDYNPKKLALGPIDGLSKDINTDVSMLAMNPMEFPETSKISLATGADYAWNMKAYDENASWEKAIKQLYGANADDFTYFANHSTRVDTGREDAPEMQAKINLFWKHLEEGADITQDAAYLRQEFQTMRDISARLLKNLPASILKETSLQLKQFAVDANNGDEALTMIQTFLSGDMTKWWDIKYSSEQHMEQSKNAPAQVSNVVRDFIKKANDEVNTLYENQIPKDKVEKISYTGSASMEALNYALWWYNAKPYEPQNFAIDDPDYAYRSKDNVKKRSWIQIDLQKPTDINSIYLLQGRTQVDKTVQGTFSYSEDGKKWTNIDKQYQDYETILTDLHIKARYVRFTASQDEDFQYFVRDFKVNKDIQNEKLSSSIKGVEATIQRSIEGTKNFLPIIQANVSNINHVQANDTFTLTLRDATYIQNINADFGVKGVVEYTSNDVDWITATKENLAAHPFVTRVRFRALENGDVDKGTLKVTTEMRNPGTLTTNYNFDKSTPISNINDYDLGSNSVDTSTKAGQWLQLDLGEITHIRDLNVVFNEAYANDRPTDVTFTYSTDGKTWKTLPFNVYSWNNKFTNLNINARYIKMVNNADRGGTWTRIGEFTVNTATPDVHFETSVNGIQPTHRVTNLTDGNLSTTYIPETTVKKGDYIIYHFDKERDLKRLHILQEVNKISNAKVIARTTDKQEYVLGTLDKGYTVLDMPKRKDVESIKIEFTSDAPIALNELTFEYYTLSAIKQEAQDALSKAQRLLQMDKSADSKKQLKTAINSLMNVLQKDDKNQIEKALDALYTQMNIYQESVNKDKLQTWISQAQEVNTTLYTQASIQALQTALKNAQNVMADPNSTQKAVDDSINAVQQALRLLVKKSESDSSKEEILSYHLASQDGTVQVTGLRTDGLQLDSKLLTPSAMKTVVSKIKDANSLALMKHFNIENLYQLTLMKGNTEYIPSENMNVSFALSSNLRDKRLGIIYISNKGVIKEIPSEIVNDKIVFHTDKNGLYGIVSYQNGKANYGVNTGDTTNIAWFVFALIGSGLTLLLAFKRQRNKLQ